LLSISYLKAGVLVKAVILNGARSEEAKVDEASQVVSSALSSFGEVDMFKLREIPIADCLGCFGCWI
jgi:multimeric flavodoxin WrbA